MRNFKTAFTMLELVFVIIVIGILSVALVPRLNQNDTLANAAFQLLSDIRYTQHLAMQDDKIDPTDNQWYKERWQLLFGKSNDTYNKYAYTIFSNGMRGGAHDGAPNLSEIAKNPLNPDKLMTGGYAGLFSTPDDKRITKEMNIGKKYNIDNVTSSGCFNSKRVAFDFLGRPYSGNNQNWNSVTDKLLTTPCIFTLHQGNKAISIKIHPFSGYACIADSNGNCI